MRNVVAGLIAAAMVIQPGVAAAFGPQGHEVVGAIADQLLSANAKAQLKSQLGFPLRVAATWADCVKDVARQANGTFQYQPDPMYHAACSAFETAPGKARMVNYVSRNWDNCTDPAAVKGCHALYHFADVAIQHDTYDRAFAGTGDHDIVSAIGAVIAVLQDRPAPAPFDIQDKAEAILLLAHLVGDLHQPLHVGSVYLDANDQEVDPGASGTQHDPKIDTRGGNRLEDGSTNLHADWDGVAKSLNPLKISSSMLVAAKGVPATAGGVDVWPAAWASETVKVSRQSFSGVSFTHAGAVKKGEWVSKFADRTTYLAMKNDVQSRQLTLAGARLAQVLNSIWP